MKTSSLLFFALMIPALIALGHDFYLFYDNYGIDSVQRDVEQQIADKGPLTFFASFGFILTRYSPETYRWLVENMDQGTWEWINLFLTQKAFFTGIAFALLIFGLIALLNFFGIGTDENKKFGQRKGSKSDDLSSVARGKKTTYKYKKK